MLTCEFCTTLFEPRPQTKNPRACNKSECQKARQSRNEKEWHIKHNELYQKAPDYHKEKRMERHKTISEKIKVIFEAMQSGFIFKNLDINFSVFYEFFTNFMHREGIRKINKFYNLAN